MSISARDRERLRTLAAQQMELSQSERNRRLYREWVAFGNREPGARPMLTIELGTFQGEMLDPLMQCEGEEARRIEVRLREKMFNFQHFGDDFLVPDHYGVGTHASFIPFSLPPRRHDKAGSIAYEYDPYLVDLEEDFHKLGRSAFRIDEAATQAEIAQAEELFGDLLPVRRQWDGFYICPTQDVVHIMRMEDLYMALYDAEDLVHRMMEMLTDDYLAYMALFEQAGLLQPTVRDEHLAQGSYCFTCDLPGEDVHSFSQVWGYLDSQETSAISPQMFRDHFFPYYKKLAARFGQLSYGCCEPVHGIWDECLSTLENLGKVSISPWCDERMMGERLRGKRTVYLRKPPATLLGSPGALDEAAVTACMEKTAEAASGCRLELAQRDVYQIGQGPQKVARYVQLIREAFDRKYKP